MNNIALQFEDGVTQFIQSKDEEKLTDAAYRQNVNIPMDCRDGACGTCKGLCESGTYNMPKSSYIDDALTQEEAENGYVLSCQMKPTSDCIVKFPVTSEVCKVTVNTYTGTLKKLTKFSDSTITFSIDFPNAENFNFFAGQYVNLQIPSSEDTRAYSLSSAPGCKEASFLVRNVPGGKMSTYLDKVAQPGDEMSFTGPYGSFYLRPVNKPILFIAGGSGIAPFLSMLDVIKDEDHNQSMRMVFGVTNDVDLVALDELNLHQRDLIDFEYRTCVVDEKSNHERKGYVTGHIDDAWLNNGDVDIYLCGPVLMVEAVRSWLSQRGIKPAGFYYEKFSAA